MLAIGAVTPTTARIWARAAAPGHYELRWQAEDDASVTGRQTIALDAPERDGTGSVAIREGLEPNRRYQVALHDGDRKLAAGRFMTAALPDAPPDRYAFALMSCHEPFDADGNLLEAAQACLEAAHQALGNHDVRHIVLGGDQLYSDMPESLSLFNDRHFERVAPPGRASILECSEPEVRRLFQERYRHFWNVPGWRRLLSEFPSYPILDDHEIVDNWGSADAHGSPEWQNFRNGAFKAYCDYQHALVAEPVSTLPDYFDYTVEFGETASYVMDLRSNRRVGEDARVVAPAQLDGLQAFLQRHQDKQVLFVVLSVPLIHLSRRLSNVLARVTPDGEDFSDRWSSRGHARSRDALIECLRAQQQAIPDQRIVLLSGDIHIGCLHQIRWRDRTPNLYQLVSSGVTHDAGTLTQVLSSLIIRANREITMTNGTSATFLPVRGERGARHNPCGRLNFAIIEMERARPGARAQLRMMLYGHRGDQPSLRYRSPAVELGP